jgi:hypothetical protein
VNADLAKAERALEFGDPAEARLHAWNALETIDPVEAGRLRRVAEELGDIGLLEALPQRDSGEASNQRRPWFRFVFAGWLAMLAVIAIVGIVAESPPPEDGRLRTAQVAPQAAPLIVESDGVWLVRVGNMERVPLRRVATQLTHRYHVSVGVLPAIDPLPKSVVDHVGYNDELDGDGLLSLVETTYGARGRATIIGVTDFRMHGRDSSRSPFMLRAYPHYAVISTAELGAGVFDRLRGHTRYERTRKLVGRSVGFLYFRMPVSSDPHSLVRSEMSGTDDIDALREAL